MKTYTAGNGRGVADYWIFDKNETVLYGHYFEGKYLIEMRSYTVNLREYPDDLTIKMNFYGTINISQFQTIYNQSIEWGNE